MRRHTARRQALKALYEAEQSGESPERIIERMAAAGGMESFAAHLVKGVSRHKDRLDSIIAERSVGWEPARMPVVDLNVQRIGAFELLFSDAPQAVVIDEAVELAKEFSTDDAARFVNGLLSSIARDREALRRSLGIEAEDEGGVSAEVRADLFGDEFDSELCPPAYGRRSLAEVGRWILAAVGLGDWDDDIYELPSPPSVRRLVVFVIDGLGAIQLRRWSDAFETIWNLPGTFATSTFPSTSATGLTSICTGALPGDHGVVGYRVIERERSFNVIRYEFDEDPADARFSASGIPTSRRSPPLPSPKRYQPCPTIFETAERAKLGAYVVTKEEFEGSGFSSLLLRGARWMGYSRSAQAPSLVRALLSDPKRKLVYVYWDGLDKEGHRTGAGSEEWFAAAAKADSLCAGFLEALRPGDGLLVTSDHGMLTTPETARLTLDSEVSRLARLVTGEPRVRYLHARPGCETELFEAALERHGSAGWVFDRNGACAAGLFGESPSKEALERAGDVIVAMRNDAVLVDPDWPKPPPLGNHGSLTDEEMFVPFRVAAVA